MLQRGLGRAVLFLRTRPDTTQFREIIRATCLEDWRSDSQVEESRAVFLFDVVQATREPKYYAQYVRDVLETIATPQEAENTCRPQVIALATSLTKNGDGDLKDTIYAAVRRIVTEPGQDILSRVDDDIIRMDGIVGYRFLAEQWLWSPREDEDKWDAIFLLSELDDQLGGAAPEALDALAKEAPHLATYITSARKARDVHNLENEKRKSSAKSARSVAPTGEDIHAYLNGVKRPKPRIHLVNAPTRERLAEELTRETDRERQVRYLRLFRSSAEPISFPGDPQALLRLVRQTEDERVAWYAALSLEHTTHPAIRTAALEFLRTENRRPHGTRLLPANPGPGDATLLLEQLARDDDPDEFHHIGMGILDYVERHGDPDLIPVMLACYEKMACSFCRGLIVRELLKRDALPLMLRAECHYDANSDTRDLVG